MNRKKQVLTATRSQFDRTPSSSESHPSEAWHEGTTQLITVQPTRHPADTAATTFFPRTNFTSRFTTSPLSVSPTLTRARPPPTTGEEVGSRSLVAATALESVLPAAAAKAVVASTYVQSVVVSALSPSAASRAASVGRVSRIGSSCAASETAAEAVSGMLRLPSSLMFVPFPSAGGVVGSGASADAALAAGALLTTGGFCFLCAACYAFGVYRPWIVDPTGPMGTTTSRGVYKVAAMLQCISITFFGPNVLELSTTLLFVDSQSTVAGSWVLRLLAAICLAVHLGSVFLTFAPVLRPPAGVFVSCAVCIHPNAAAPSDTGEETHEPEGSQMISPHDTSNVSDSAAALGALHVFVDGARSLPDVKCRALLLEDVSAATALSVLSGVSHISNTVRSCAALSAAMALVSIAHAVYLLLVRPYLSMLEQSLAAAIAVLAVLQSLISVAMTVQQPPSGTLASMSAMLQLVLSVIFFGQLFVLATVEVWRLVKSRRPQNEVKAPRRDGPATAPLLQVPLDAEPGPSVAVPSEPSKPHANPLGRRL